MLERCVRQAYWLKDTFIVYTIVIILNGTGRHCYIFVYRLRGRYMIHNRRYKHIH